jgi:hypothetical protein
VPTAGGFDVLAAYSDGTARYVNHSGKVIVWDLADAQVGAQISRVLDSARNLETTDAPRNRGNWPNDDIVRVALLTLNGNRLAEVEMRSLRASPISSVLTVAAELMANLIRRAQVTV